MSPTPIAALLYLMALDGRGIPPAQWPAEVVAKLGAEGGGSAYRGGGRTLLYLYARETAPTADAAAAIEQVLAVANELRADLVRVYFAEAALWQAVANRNPTVARAWLDDARAVKGAVPQEDWDAAALTAIAIAESYDSQAREYLKRGFAYLDRQPGPSGSVAAARARLGALMDGAL